MITLLQIYCWVRYWEINVTISKYLMQLCTLNNNSVTHLCVTMQHTCPPYNIGSPVEVSTSSLTSSPVLSASMTSCRWRRARFRRRASRCRSVSRVRLRWIQTQAAAVVVTSGTASRPAVTGVTAPAGGVSATLCISHGITDTQTFETRPKFCCCSFVSTYLSLSLSLCRIALL